MCRHRSHSCFYNRVGALFQAVLTIFWDDSGNEPLCHGETVRIWSLISSSAPTGVSPRIFAMVACCHLDDACAAVISTTNGRRDLPRPLFTPLVGNVLNPRCNRFLSSFEMTDKTIQGAHTGAPLPHSHYMAVGGCLDLVFDLSSEVVSELGSPKKPIIGPGTWSKYCSSQ